MCALVYLSEMEEKESPSTQDAFTICTKCGQFIRIDGQCECEAIFFDIFLKTR
jgi:hypothetical protein